MKKFFWIPILLLIIIVFIIIIYNKPQRFYLNEQYYENNTLININSDELIKLEETKQSFVVFVYDPLCSTSYELNNHVIEFINKYKISFYKVIFSNIKDTKINKSIKYCPSIVIYKDGKIISYLDAASNKDIIYYESSENLKMWLNKYIYVEYDN
ncbi:MAG: thioredoxin domain-containing protein [Bacilli bacterium]|nr:thioredoxin domain-containing protein [Bacilli bacterium]